MVLWLAALLLVLALGWLLYAPLADAWLNRARRYGIFRRGPRIARTLALTLDGDPDPALTPELLALLQTYGASVTLFPTAEGAGRYPELLRCIAAKGHEIGVSGRRPDHAWRLAPWSVRRQLAEASAQLERVLGHRIRWARPPKGRLNLAWPAACRRLGLRIALWSPRLDTETHASTEEMTTRLLDAVEPGAILRLHLAGAPEQGRAALAALRAVLEVLAALDYRCVTLSELFENDEQARSTGPSAVSVDEVVRGYPWWRRAWVRLWTVVEWGFTKARDIRSVHTIFRASRTRWDAGERRDAAGRTVLVDGMPALDLHFHNDLLITLSSEHDPRALVRGLRLVRDGLRDLARWLAHHPHYRDIQVVTAITLMNRGIESLGFHVEPLPDTRKMRRTERYLRFLMGLYHPDGFRRLREGHQPLRARRVWITREELLRRYGGESAEGSVNGGIAAEHGTQMPSRRRSSDGS